MSLLHEICRWSTGLKPCLRDALRRLLQNSPLTDDDFDALFALVKLEAGIPDANGRAPECLDARHLPSTAAIGTSVRLLAIRKLKHVNRIAPDQTLEFAPVGLTVVYGDNGTGKSGYSRVLKSACRARGEAVRVLPNAHLPVQRQGTPEAELVIECNGVKSKHRWNPTASDIAEMSAISVFDSHCARAYLDAEQDVAYVPYGLDIVEDLANVVLPELNRRLKEEVRKCDVDLSQFDDLAGDTEVGRLIMDLSAQTDRSTVEKLATITKEDGVRYAELCATLAESDPKVKAPSIRRIAQRLEGVLAKIDRSWKVVDSAAVVALKKVVQEAESATAAEMLAAAEFHAGEILLPNTGGAEWRILFDSARAFAQVAFRDAGFPVSAEDPRCLLCQQELKNDGTNRLRRFDQFVQDETAQNAELKRTNRNESIARLSGTSIAFGLDEPLAEEVAPYDSELCRSLQAFETQVTCRRIWLTQAAKANDWSSEPHVNNGPRNALESRIKFLREKAAEHDRASNEQTRLGMQRQRDALGARVRLVQRKAAVLAAIDNLRTAASLRSCAEHLRPRPISMKSKELSQTAVTQALSDALNREFRALNIGHLKTNLTSRVRDGKTYHKVLLDVPNTQKLADILSEGELRVMAIASFLAELSLSGHSGGAVFDDPVSSLDHFRRATLARRLAEESAHRQVIIFTHDTVFLSELRYQAEQAKVDTRFHHLEWTMSDFAGYCNDGLPWHHQGYKDRLDALEKEQRALAQIWRPHPNSELRDKMQTAYSHLRQTIERVVESVFLSGVVRRFENYVRVADIEKVVALTEAELRELNRLFHLASGVTNAHDSASGGNFAVPCPDDLKKEIESLRTLVMDYRTRLKPIS